MLTGRKISLNLLSNTVITQRLVRHCKQPYLLTTRYINTRNFPKQPYLLTTGYINTRNFSVVISNVYAYTVGKPRGILLCIKCVIMCVCVKRVYARLSHYQLAGDPRLLDSANSRQLAACAVLGKSAASDGWWHPAHRTFLVNKSDTQVGTTCETFSHYVAHAHRLFCFRANLLHMNNGGALFLSAGCVFGSSSLMGFYLWNQSLAFNLFLKVSENIDTV